MPAPDHLHVDIDVGTDTILLLLIGSLDEASADAFLDDVLTIPLDRTVVLDLVNLDRIDAAGVAAVRHLAGAVERGTAVVAWGASDAVRRALRDEGLHHLVAIL